MAKDEKGKPAKEYTIVVNGREKTVTATELGEDDLVALAYENPPTGELICFTITSRRAPCPSCRRWPLPARCWPIAA